MCMDNQLILREQSGEILTLTINRPNQLNALNKETIKALSDALGEAENNNSVRVVILTGSGEKAFVAGADIKEFAHFSVDEGKRLSAEGHGILFTKLAQMTTPVIAAVNGFALGGGLELAMSAHIRVASNRARLGLPEVSLGVIPGYGGTQRLTRLVGYGRALEMITTAGMVSADDAWRMGLVNHVCEPEALLDFCHELAGKIAKNSPTAIAAAIRAVNAGFEPGVDGLSAEVEEFGKCFGTDDFKEGTTAFLEKRKAQFTGN
ncbi:MAG: enoyl-CoA hydratase [Cryomorphaceae bacterium]|nr:MAG: enoyl-CoA hydratase [Cryomorphaceae bacterium]